MSYWDDVYWYYQNIGIPKTVLDFFCISWSEADQISQIIERTHPQTILEIGTFLGLSTGVIALAMDTESKLVCVDPNEAVEVLSARVGFAEKRGTLFFVRAMLEHFQKEAHLLEGFFTSDSHGYDEKFFATGGDISIVAQHQKIAIVGHQIKMHAPYDLVFLDGDHTASSVYNDLSLLASYLSEYSLVILHDVIGKWGEQVLAGVHQFMQEHPDFSLKNRP